MADFKSQKRGKSHVQNMGICFCGSGHGPESSSQISANYKFFSNKALSPPRISQIFQSAEIRKRKISANYKFFSNKALSPPRISQIFQSAEIRKRKMSEILKEFLGGASMLHQNIPTEILIIFASQFLQSGRYKKFSVEHTLCGKM